MWADVFFRGCRARIVWPLDPEPIEKRIGQRTIPRAPVLCGRARPGKPVKRRQERHQK